MTKRKQMITCVANLSENWVTLKKGEQIGQFEYILWVIQCEKENLKENLDSHDGCD